ncbi:hypothetical protein [uncultured Caulobacter sp.]|uniref:hypothetical protein n=1 Tax=uncultured Caulobacter sp. TaxID=158749 RepID=UPI00260E61C9|nr:hypothetical protein [uncultured Caulobacter sp.]
MTLISRFSKVYGSSRLLRGLLFGVIAAPVGYLLGHWLASLPTLGDWKPDWSDLLAVTVGLLMVGMGVGILIVSANRKALGRQLDPERGVPATPAQTIYYVQNAVVLLLAGVMIVTPVAVRAAFDGPPVIIASIAMTGLIALFLLQSAVNLSVWMRSDELVRRAMVEIAALAFMILQAALFLWAAGQKLGLLPVLTLWDATPVMMAVYLLISFVVAWRRGLT